MNIRKYATGIIAALLLVASLPASAACFLRQSTASQEIPLGPFVDSTDGNTAETGLTIANTDIKLQKGGATTQANKNSGGATHIATGDYYAVLDATDTDTVGNLRIKVHVSGALPVWLDCVVLEEAIYDRDYAASATGAVSVATGGIVAASFASGAIDAAAIATDAIGAAEIAADAIGASELATDAIGAAEIAANAITTSEFADGTITAAKIAADAITAAKVAADVSTEFSAATFTVNATQISGDSAAADALETWLDGTAGSAIPIGIVDQGTAQSATATTLVLRSALAMADDTAIGMTLVACGSTQGYCQSRAITDYVQSSDTATVETWTVTPSGTITYYLFGTAPGASGGGLDAAGVRAAVGLATANLDTQLNGIQSDTDNLQTRVPTSLVSGRMDSSVGAYQSGLTPLQPTVAGRTLDVSTGGEAGVDWANVGSPTTTVGLSGTTISTSQAIASVTGAVGSVTGNVGGNVTGTIGGLTAAAVADFFDTNSGTTYASAVAGSVVKEMADNAGGSALTTDAIAEAMFTYNATADYSTATAGSVVKEIADNAGGSALTVEAIRAEMDSNSTQLAKIGTISNLGSGATIGANLADIEGQTDDIGAAGAGLTAADDAVMTRLGAPAGASVSADIAAVKSDSAAILVDTGTTLDAALATVDSNVDAVKAKTDSLTFTNAGEVDANVKSMNDAEVCGVGSDGDPWADCE